MGVLTAFCSCFVEMADVAAPNVHVSIAVDAKIAGKAEVTAEMYAVCCFHVICIGTLCKRLK